MDDYTKNNTKEQFLKVFRELLKTKHFSSITIQDIVAASGLSRQTFYRNFQDKYDLLFYMYSSDLQPFYEQCAFTDIVELSTYVADYFKKNQLIYRAVGTDLLNPNPFLRQWLELNFQYFEKAIGKKAITPELQIAIDMFVYGSYVVDYEYMVNNLKGTPRKIGKMVASNMPEILKPYFYFKD